MSRIYRSFASTKILCLALSGFTGTQIVSAATETYSPPARQTYPQNVFWGDTHLHTNLSLDANGMGNKKLGLDEAYRFVRGETVTGNNGMQAKLRRPLDFLVVADHGRNIGLLHELYSENPHPGIRKTSTGKLWSEAVDKLKAKGDAASTAEKNFFWAMWENKEVKDPSFRKSMWQLITEGAEKYNEPGRFTAFIGYEWTPFDWLHRVVIFKDGAEKANRVLPFTAYDSPKPEKLWAYMANYQQTTGGDVLAIPHNPNLTSGVMFALQDSDGRPLTREYAQMRSHWEPLLEVTQIKGDSETHPYVSPGDEFADFETWNSPLGRQNGGKVRAEDLEYEVKPRDDRKIQYEYARPALKLGLSQQIATGVNPFKFGMIGSTDAHTSLAAVDENNFWGKGASREPNPNRSGPPGGLHGAGWQYNAAGYAAVWAHENTRESLFEAMRRKETYATTGPRMTVRFFGGWEYRNSDAYSIDLPAIGYRKGVPMGGDLTKAPVNRSLNFLIRAVKDPDGANLDRVQVIKGWRDAKGTLHERVYNVALSDGRRETKNGKVSAVGSTVDIENATYTNTIGAAELAIVWQDPDFNAAEPAFYYVRVLEIPTPRWTAYDAKYFGLKNLSKDTLMVTQERAYTSPIWYTP